ncbi:VrrA/YqfQ family protein [Fredinandcohnia humi]
MFFPRRPMPPMNPPSMFTNPFGYPPQMMQRRAGLGGLLSRLFPGMGLSQQMQRMGGMQGFFNPTSFQGMNNPRSLQNLANPSNLSAMMGNIQKTLKMAETVVPMVQQYGPLFKNIPAMIKMYSAIKNAGNDDNKSTDSTTISLSDENESTNHSEENTEKPSGNGKSVPKLYI